MIPPDDKPPDGKPTREFERPPEWAISLTEKVNTGFTNLRADVSLIANDVSLVKERVGLVEQRTANLEEAKTKNSLRAQQSSQVDMEQAAQLAQERTSREELAKKVDDLTMKTDAQTAILTQIYESGGRLLKHPLVIIAIAILTGLLSTYAHNHGIEIPK